MHRYRLHWLLRDDPNVWDEDARCLTLYTPRGAYVVQSGTAGGAAVHSLLRADTQSARGWQAPYYGVRTPAPSLDMTVQASHAVLWTLFGPRASEVNVNDSDFLIQNDDWQARLTLAPSGADALFSAIQLSGSVEDQIEFTSCASS